MLKRLIQCIREYKKAALLAPFFIVLEVICEVSIPFLMARLIDSGIDVGNMQVILQTGLFLIGLALLAMLFGVVSARYAADTSAGFACNLRHDLFYRSQEFAFSNIDKFSTGGIVTRLTTDVTNVQMAFMMIIRIAVRCPVMLIFALSMSFSINNTLSLIFLGAIPILGLGLFVIMKKAYPVFQRVFSRYDDLNNVVEENVRGIRVVKSFVREAHEVKKFEKVSENIYQDYSLAERILVAATPLMQFCMYASMLLIAWIGARLIVSDVMTTGQLVSIISYAMQILMSLMMLAMVFVMITLSRASVSRIGELLLEEPAMHNPEQPQTVVKDGSIRMQDVNFSYANDPDKLCLRNINLEIKSGSTIGIIGGTGAAKTSLVQLIPRLYDTTLGSVQVGGVDVRDYDMHALRDAVGMVLQKNTLFSGTIKENLRWGNPNASDEELVEACKLASAHDFIENFEQGYDTRIEQGGSNVSGGQRQRLAIARALLKQPKILILDDSTSAVDTATDAKIRQAFREQIPHTTKLIIAQRVASVQDADQIIVMDNGEISDIGSHDELLARSQIYREVYESQQKGGAADEA